MKVLLAITTGREVFSTTIRMLVRNLRHFGWDGAFELSLLINYDQQLCGLSQSAFYFEDSTTAFSRILYLGPPEVRDFEARSILAGVPQEMVSCLTSPIGYSCRKNLILLEALRRNIDLVLFWDDDEYPFVLMDRGGAPAWEQTDVFGAHSKQFNLDADLSFGFWTGYVSPISRDLVRLLSSKTASLLGTALSLGTETFQPRSFLDSAENFVVLKDYPHPAEIHPIRGGKWISGGNVSFSVNALRELKIPPFYTPPMSRGDDSIMSLRLNKARVCRVESGIFHDCFMDYTSIASGNFPRTFDPPAVPHEKALARFGSALRGWLAYSPLFLRIRKPQGYQRVLNEMSEALSELDHHIISDIPEWPKYFPERSISKMFAAICSDLARQYEELCHFDSLWPSFVSDDATAPCCTERAPTK